MSIHRVQKYLDAKQIFCVTDIPFPEFLEFGKRISKTQTTIPEFPERA
jgi:hypothetical protein